MSDINTIALSGRLATEPTQRFTPRGSVVATFPIVVNRAYRGSDGELVKTKFSIRIHVWGASGAAAAKHLIKGQEVFVEGYLDIRPGTGKYDGQYFTEVTARNVRFGQKPSAHVDEPEGEFTGEPAEEQIPF